MAARTTAPYGTWRSAIDADTAARAGGKFFGAVVLDAAGLRWIESRPEEGGRGIVCDRDGDITPAGVNVRTRVHEYGGGAWWPHGETIFFSDFADGRLHRQDGRASKPRPLTAEPAAPHALRYADGSVTPDGSTVVCVRERHDAEGVTNELVAIPADGGDPQVIVSGADFYAAPRISPDGTRLAWLSWDHPRMPWDGTELWVAAVDGTGARLLAGGPEESIFQPEWSPEGLLHFCSDRTGWWNLYTEDAQVTDVQADIGVAMWGLSARRYAFLGDGRIACVVTRAASDSLALLDPRAGSLEPLELEWTAYWAALAAHGSAIAFQAGSSRAPTTLVVIDTETGREERVRTALDAELDPASISVPRAIDFPTADGAIAHAFYYPPENAEYDAPQGERPPLRVICHGGPTAHSAPELEVTIQFFTQRGIGVVDVNYRGSTGFGRAYREELRGRWGDADVADCVAAARHLADAGETDPERTWVEGGSAGGYVVLCALVFHPHAFAAGVSLYGVADIEALARDTHKFESRYLDALVPAELQRARSPIHFVDRLERPLLLLQGLDDEVVPPSQAEMMVEALERKEIPYAYLAFEGEGHGFRRRENLRRTFEAVLSFTGQVFGFEPGDELEPLELVHLNRSATAAE